MSKISIIGAGMTGATTAHWLAERDWRSRVGSTSWRDAAGKALDMLQAMPIISRDVDIVGYNDFDATRASDIVILTAGLRASRHEP